MKKFKNLVLISALMTALSAHAGGGGLTGGATEITQLLNNTQLVQQYSMQIQQYEAQLRNLANLQQWVSVNPIASINKLANVVESGEALGLSGARIASKMQTAYGSNAGGPSVGDYNTWMRTTKDSIRSSMSAIGAQQDDMASDADNIRTLAYASQNADGSVAVAQAGNQISVEMLQQMQKLRSLNMAQGQALNAHMLAAQQKQENDDAVSNRLFSGQNIAPTRQSRDAFKNQIKGM